MQIKTPSGFIEHSELKRLLDTSSMTADIADRNGVVAAECCGHCSHYWGLYSNCFPEEPGKGSFCGKLKCWTYMTDVCNHYHGSNEN